MAHRLMSLQCLHILLWQLQTQIRVVVLQVPCKKEDLHDFPSYTCPLYKVSSRSAHAESTTRQAAHKEASAKQRPRKYFGQFQQSHANFVNFLHAMQWHRCTESARPFGRRLRHVTLTSLCDTRKGVLSTTGHSTNFVAA
eukprot:5933735-Amphidinium_carterae.1